MSQRRFEVIKRFLHFCNNEDYAGEKLFKIKPLLGVFEASFNSVTKSTMLSIDELRIPFKGISPLKQYNPKKPKKWGYRCLLWQHLFDTRLQIWPGQLDLGASGNIMLRFVQHIPRVGCQAKIKLVAKRNPGRLQITISMLEHAGHDVSKEMDRLYPENRQVQLNSATHLLMSCTTIQPSEVRHMLEQQHDVDSLPRNIYNLKSKLNKSSADATETEGIIQSITRAGRKCSLWPDRKW